LRFAVVVRCVTRGVTWRVTCEVPMLRVVKRGTWALRVVKCGTLVLRVVKCGAPPARGVKCGVA
jgi:hypothetical protein